MMAVMLLGMPPVHGCPTDAGSGTSRGGSGPEPRIHPTTLTGGDGGSPTTGDQDGPRTVHETPPGRQDEPATLQILHQTRLEMEKVRTVGEEMQEKRLEMRRTFLQEIKEMKKTFRLDEEGMRDTHQPQLSSQRHLGEVWKLGDDGPILERVGGANLPADGGGTASNN
jgi:hypothetical protein